jgi:hypothetical protein
LSNRHPGLGRQAGSRLFHTTLTQRTGERCQLCQFALAQLRVGRDDRPAFWCELTKYLLGRFPTGVGERSARSSIFLNSELQVLFFAE